MSSLSSLNLSIVGAGSTGIASSLYLRKYDFAHTLYEASPSLGGLLRDFSVSEEPFFAGPQYLEPGSQLASLLPTNPLKRYPHTYSSYTDFTHPQLTANFSGPTFCLKDSLLRPLPLTPVSQSAEEYLSYLPTVAASHLYAWLRSLSLDPATLHYKSLISIQCFRSFFPDYIDQLIELKRSHPKNYNHFGLPRTYLGLPSIYTLLPHSGYSAYLDTTIKPLLNSSLQLCSPYPSFTTTNQHELPETVIYTSNPTHLINSRSIITARPVPLPVRYTFGFLEECPSVLPHYIQVFSAHVKLLRIFVYTIDNITKFTVESLNSSSEASVIDYAASILRLKYCTNTLKMHAYCSHKAVRYNMFDVASFEYLSNLSCLDIGSVRYYFPSLTSSSRDERVRSSLEIIDRLIN